MSRTLELPDEVYADLEKAARIKLKSPVAFVADAAKSAIEVPATGQPLTLYDQVHDLVGSFESGGADVLSEDPNDPFFNGLLKKKREGHL